MSDGARVVSIVPREGIPWNSPIMNEGRLPLREPGALVNPDFDLEPGNYEMVWGVAQVEGTDKLFAVFDLVADQSDEVSWQWILPLIPYFSGVHVTNMSSGLFPGGEKIQRELLDVFGDQSKSRDLMDLGNEFMQAQSRAFQDVLDGWLDMEEDELRQITGNLTIMIGSSFTILMGFKPEVVSDRPLVVLPKGTRLG